MIRSQAGYQQAQFPSTVSDILCGNVSSLGESSDCACNIFASRSSSLLPDLSLTDTIN